MSCKVNFLKSSGISNSEFNQLLLFKGLFDEFMSHYNNVTGEDGKGLAKFENEYLSESVRKEFEQYIKDLRTFKRTGKIDNPSSEDFITFVVNNNLNSSVLIDLRDRFIKDFFVFVDTSNLYLEKGKDPDFLRVIPSDYKKHFDKQGRPVKGGDNLIMNFLTYVQTSYSKRLNTQLEDAIKNNNTDQIFVYNVALNFIKSLRLNEPIISKKGVSGVVISEENIKNNPSLKLLLEFLYEPFPVTIAENKQGLTEEDTEGNREIYEKNPVQVDPFDKVSPFIKMLMAGISKDVNQDSSFGKNFWNPTEFAVMMLEEFHKDGDFSVKNFTDKLSKLEKIANKNKSLHPKYQSIATFIDRYRIIERIHKDNPDKLNDLKVDLQNWLQNINVNYRMVKSKKFSGRTYYPTYLSDSSKDKVKTVNNVQKNLEELLFNLNETYRSTNRVLTSEKFAEEVKSFLAFNYLKSDIDLKGIFEKNNNKLINDNGTEINKKLINDIVNEESLLADFFSHEAVNVEGESIYPVVRPSFLTETVSKINRSIRGIDKSFIEDLEGTYMENSIFFDYAENKTDLANNNLLEISINNGIDIEQKNTKVKYTSYKSDELVSFLLNTYLNINYASDKIGPTHNKSYNLMGGIPADAQNVFSIDNFNNLNEILDIQVNKHFEKFETILNKQPNTFAKNRMIMLLNLIKTDLDLYENNQSVKNGISKNVNEAFKNGKTLILANFDDVVGNGTNNRVIELFEQIQNGEGTKESFDELEQLLKLYQTNLIKRDINSLIETGLVEKVDEKVDGENTLKLNDDTNLFSKKIKESKTFTQDLQNALFYYYFLTTQTNMLTSGHPAFYKAGDMTKRNKSPFSNTTRPFIEASEKVGDEIITIPEKIRTIVINDIEEYLDPESEFGKHLLKSLEENFDKQNIGKEDDKDYEIRKDRFLTKQMSNLFSNHTDANGVKMYVLPKYIKDGKVEANAIMEKSKITNTTDAASIVSPIMKQYLNIAFNENSDSQKQFYLAEKKGGKGRNIPEKHGNNTVMKNFVFTHHNKVNAMIVKTSQSNFDGQLVFMGGKINYTYAAIGTLMGYEFDFKNKTYKYNPNKAKVEQVVFASTLKATTPNSKEDKNPDENKSVVKDISEASEMLKNDNTSFVKDYESDIVEIDFWDNTKQQDTPEHLEDRGDVGTQLMKLVYYAVDPTGEYKVGNETLSGKQVVEKINDILIEINKRNVENFTNNTINSKNFFHELILELYSSRKELDIMSVDEEKVEELLKNPVFAAELLPKVMAKLKQELLKVKLNTFSAYNGVIPGDDSLEIKVEDDKVIFEIALPLTNMELYELLLEEDGTINIDKKDENNNFIYPQELRERIVYRIPTEAIYSTFVVRVKHFTHPTAGAIAYMPKGTTTMAGFDMDIDKLFGFMKNYKIIKKTDKDKNTKVVGVKYKDYNDDEQNFNDYFWKNLSEEDADDIFQMKDITKDIQSEIDTINKQLEDLKKEVNYVVDKRIKDENLDESRKKEIFKKTLYEETNYEGLKEQRINLVKDITGSKSAYSKELQAYREKYRETFNALSELEKIDNDGLENYLIDLYTTIISNKASMTELSTGNNADRQDRHAKEMSSGGKKSVAYKMANISEQVDSHKAIMTGKENIGIGASKNSGIALLQQMYILLDGEAIFNYSGTTKVRQSDFVTNNLDINGNKINLSIASILAQAVDNIKNPVAELINYYPNLLSNHIFLYTLGLDPEIVDRLFTWGKINTLIKDGFKNNRLSTNIFEEDFMLNAENNKKYDEFLDSDNMLDLSKLKELRFSEIGVDEDFDKYMQRKGISPEAIIGLLNHISADSGKIGGFISALNLIDKGLGSNLNEILKNLEIIDNAIGNMNSDIPYINPRVAQAYSFNKLMSMKTQTESLLKNKLNININSDNLKTIFKKFEELQIRVSSRKGKVYEHVQSLNYLFNKLGINSIEDITKLEDYFTSIQDDINDIESILKSSDNNSIPELRLLKNILFIKNVDSTNKNIKKFDFIPTNVAGLYNFDHLRTGKVLHFKTIHPAYNNVKNPKSILDTMSLITSKTLKYTDKNGNLQTITYRDFVSLLYKINEFQALTVKKESSKELSNAFTKLFLDNLIIQADNNVLENLTKGNKTIEEAGENMSIFASNILGKTLFETMLFNNPDFLKAASTRIDGTTKYVNKNLKFVQASNNKNKLELNENIFKLANFSNIKKVKDSDNKLAFNNFYILVDVKKGFKLKPYVVIGLSNGNETFNFIARVETPDDPNEAQYKRLVIIGNLEGKSVFSQSYNYNLLILQNKVESKTLGIEEADVLSNAEDSMPVTPKRVESNENVGGNETAKTPTTEQVDNKDNTDVPPCI